MSTPRSTRTLSVKVALARLTRTPRLRLRPASPRLTIIVVNAARCLAEVARGIVIIRIILARRAANTASNDRRTLRTSGFLL